jgi:Multidrug resistance efflux pump
MKSIIGKILIAVIVIALIVAGYYIWKSKQDTGPGPGFVNGNGRLEATEIDISTKLAGRVVDILVNEGDYVQKGQILAIMQTDTLEAQKNEAIAQVAQAKTTLASSLAQIEVKISDVNAAQATMDQRQSELDQTQRRWKRSETLSERGVITGQEFDDDETNRNAAQAAVASAAAQVKVAQASVEAARADAAGARAAIAAAEATVARIEADIKDSSLSSPREGRIQYKVAQPGEVLAAGGRVLNFVDLSDVYMTFFLSEQAAGQTAIGSEVRLLLDAFPEYPIPAKVTFVSSVAQFTPKTVETENERQKLMFKIKANVNGDFLSRYKDQVKTGLPGVAWIRLDPKVAWLEELTIKNP